MSQLISLHERERLFTDTDGSQIRSTQPFNDIRHRLGQKFLVNQNHFTVIEVNVYLIVSE